MRWSWSIALSIAHGTFNDFERRSLKTHQRLRHRELRLPIIGLSCGRLEN
jgi:hypothetical protein